MSRLPQPVSVLAAGARLAVGAVAAMALALACAREASAAPRAGAQWYVETVGASCIDQRAALEREITLACNAVGGTCHVATTPGDAELRAVLDCSGGAESWTLVTRTVEGTVLATLDLAGPRADRLREAAVEVARDAAPERALAIETLRNTIPNETPTSSERPSSRVAMLAGGRVSTLTRTDASAIFGLHVMGGLAIAKSARLTLGGSAEAGGTGTAALRHYRTGAGLAFGAPFDEAAALGTALEAGVGATSTYGARPSDGGDLKARTNSTGYVQGTFTVQAPRGSVRPFFAFSAAMLTDGLHIVGTGEAGLAFALF
jgi:hypothetical protein